MDNPAKLLADEHGVATSTGTGWVKDSNSIISNSKNTKSNKTKKIKLSPYDVVENPLLLCINNRQLPSDCYGSGLSNKELFFLPPGTTSRTQPMGVIANFKYYYRFEIMKRYLVNIDNSISTDITVLLKYDHIVNAWSNVKISTIVNCFRKCNFIFDDESTIIYDNTDVANLNHLYLTDLMCTFVYTYMCIIVILM